MKGTGTDVETFYIIGTPWGYWHWGNSGCLNDCWGEPLTAERFDTKKKAETCIAEMYGEHDGYEPKVLKVTQTVKVEEVFE